MAGGLVLVFLMVGCALYRNDRAWLSDDQYALVRGLYIQSGSLDLVQRELVDMEWRRGSINEAVYRLQKEFEVLPEELPAPAAPATTSTTATRSVRTPG